MRNKQPEFYNKCGIDTRINAPLIKNKLIRLLIYLLILPVGFAFKIAIAKYVGQDCMIQYTQDCKRYGICEGYVYKFNNFTYHIEHKQNRVNESIEKWRIGDTKNCNINSKNPFINGFNYLYCKEVNLFY